MAIHWRHYISTKTHFEITPPNLPVSIQGTLARRHRMHYAQYFIFSGITPLTPPRGSCISPSRRGIR